MMKKIMWVIGITMIISSCCPRNGRKALGFGDVLIKADNILDKKYGGSFVGLSNADGDSLRMDVVEFLNSEKIELSCFYNEGISDQHLIAELSLRVLYDIYYKYDTPPSEFSDEDLKWELENQIRAENCIRKKNDIAQIRANSLVKGENIRITVPSKMMSDRRYLGFSLECPDDPWHSEDLENMIISGRVEGMTVDYETRSFHLFLHVIECNYEDALYMMKGVKVGEVLSFDLKNSMKMESF